MFWRASQSGGRAKFRGRKGRNTAGQHGDICATDSIGEPLIDMLTIECKRGYNTDTIQDLMDLRDCDGQQNFEDWLQQTLESWEQAGSFAWMMLVKRDSCGPLAFIAKSFITAMEEMGCFRIKPRRFVMLSVPVRFYPKRVKGRAHRPFKTVQVEAAVMQLDEFLTILKPNTARLLARQV